MAKPTRRLTTGERLGARRPFFLGGAYEVENLYGADEIALMRFRADVYNQTKSLPDGAKVTLVRRDSKVADPS
jgi:hypothetical protein